jgi:ketosteroid isomerase-like protein
MGAKVSDMQLGLVLDAVAVSLLLLVLGVSDARGFDETLEGKAVQDLFERGLPQAWANLDADKILEFYTESALFLTIPMGRGGKDRYRQSLEADFSRLRALEEPSWEVQRLTFENEIAMAKVRIREKAVTLSGSTLNRRDTYYYRLIKVEDSWKIFLQSYRKNFSLEPKDGLHRVLTPSDPPPSE